MHCSVWKKWWSMWAKFSPHEKWIYVLLWDSVICIVDRFVFFLLEKFSFQNEQRRLLLFGALFLPLHPCTCFLDKRKKKKVSGLWWISFFTFLFAWQIIRNLHESPAVFRLFVFAMCNWISDMYFCLSIFLLNAFVLRKFGVSASA